MHSNVHSILRCMDDIKGRPISKVFSVWKLPELFSIWVWKYIIPNAVVGLDFTEYVFDFQKLFFEKLFK